MFIDASALVAILCREQGYERVADCLRQAPYRLTSALAQFEAVLAVARIQSLPPETAERLVNSFRETVGIKVVALGLAEISIAVAAHARYGKGRHPARLNLGDCFAYACAQVHGVPLLYVGDDFPQTDIRSALA
ncbi:type II toxin-antitoxin system VapC family toxin [Methylobacterium mesophilicum SR1.6/6]|uniref:Ribonuclease VapC n=1 Tax=Methylobacterium mesophilicum SR1.6/6 TaxID=908290 RepID=A0A6B9FUQ5_9HYPH|nr:type II toxin-antitoxin system VapC family toxin [Methylobacterium mesophilicum]QGY04838.1 type II toxin-antitoxin system VapC family toxin [Methylobacterium mesophilicum SR1.6/6]